MFGWLKKKKKRRAPQPTEAELAMFRKTMATADRADRRDKAVAALRSLNVVEPETYDNLAADLSIGLMRRLARMNDLSTKDDDVAFSAGLLGFCAANHFARMLDQEFEVTTIMMMTGLAPDPISFGRLHMEVMTEFNRMTQEDAQIIRIFGQSVAEWFSNPSQERLGRLSDIFMIGYRSVHTTPV